MEGEGGRNDDGLHEEVEQMYAKMSGLWRSQGGAGSDRVDIQALVFQVSTAEERLARHSALGGIVVGAATEALRALPFGAPVAAALGAFYSRAVLVGVAVCCLFASVYVCLCG